MKQTLMYLLVVMVSATVVLGADIYDAIEQGNTKEVQALLNKGVNVNQMRDEGFTPLHAALFAGEIEIAKLLIAKGAKNSADGEGITPLHIAAGFGQVEVMNLLLQKGADVNAKDKDGFTPLHNACVAGNLDSVNVLVQKKANVNIKDSEGRTALSLVESYANQEDADSESLIKIIALLKAKGAK